MMNTASFPHIFTSPPSIKPNAVLAAPTVPGVGFAESMSVALTQAAQFNSLHTAKDDTALPDVDAKLAEIKAENIRTPEDMEYLLKYDPKLIEITAKGNQHPNCITLTASEIDYAQKTLGGINSMAYLSPDEKNMFDSLVASGNQDAAIAICSIALARYSSRVGYATDSVGNMAFDPINMPITSYNVEKYFCHRFSNDPNNVGGMATQSQLQSLIQYLQSQHT